MIQKYVITGGPGSGKSSLLKELEKHGYAISPEASRQIITEETLAGSGCLPLQDFDCFSNKVLQRMKDLYSKIPENKVCFLDRGVPDIIAYRHVADLPLTPDYQNALKQCVYSNTVFILPPWPDIYVKDAARWQTYEEAMHLYKVTKGTYVSLGFNLEEVPICPIGMRADFVLNHLKDNITPPK